MYVYFKMLMYHLESRRPHGCTASHTSNSNQCVLTQLGIFLENYRNTETMLSSMSCSSTATHLLTRRDYKPLKERRSHSVKQSDLVLNMSGTVLKRPVNEPLCNSLSGQERRGNELLLELVIQPN